MVFYFAEYTWPKNIIVRICFRGLTYLYSGSTDIRCFLVSRFAAEPGVSSESEVIRVVTVVFVG